MTDVLGAVRAHVTTHFAGRGSTAEPVGASVTFLGADPIEVLRFGPTDGDVYHYVSQGCSRYPMADPMDMMADGVSGLRAEAVLALRGQLCPRAVLTDQRIIDAAEGILDGLFIMQARRRQR